MADTTLPSVQEIVLNAPKTAGDSTAPLAKTLSLLFEKSPILFSKLVPQLATSLTHDPSSVTTYTDLIDKAIESISSWDDSHKAEFVKGHPRIGESHNLSKLSAKEQGTNNPNASAATPPEVLARLAHLNACYEHVYPDLVYITFVNGRSRAAIAEEIEDVLGIEHSLDASEPPAVELVVVGKGETKWRSELNRAVVDVGRIAKSRLKGLGVE